MHRSRTALMAGLALCGALAATAAALASAYQQRLEKFRAQAAEQRRKLGLQERSPELLAKYPTPEVELRGELASAACGAVVPVRIHGKFQKGTLFVVHSDEVRVTDEKLGDASWEAKLHLPKVILPQSITVSATAPVSEAERSTHVVQVRGRYELDLKFSDGWAARVTPAGESEGDRFAADVAWKKGGEARKARADVDSNGRGLTVHVEATAEDEALQHEQAEKLRDAVANSGMDALMKKMQACQALPQEEMLACIQKLQGEADRTGQQMREKEQAVTREIEQKRSTAAWACRTWRLQARGGELSGDAECSGEAKLRVTGTVRCLEQRP